MGGIDMTCLRAKPICGWAALLGGLFGSWSAAPVLAQGNQAALPTVSPGPGGNPTQTPPPVPEANPEYRFDFTLLGGGHFFTNEHVLGHTDYGSNDPSASPLNAGMFGAIMGFHFNRWIGLEGETMAIPTHTRGGSADGFLVGGVAQAAPEIREWVFAYRGSFVLNLSDNYMVQPFLLAGYGGLTSMSAAAPAGTPAEITPSSNRNWGFVHAGLGLKLGLTPRVGIRLDGRIMAPWTFILPLSGYAAAKGPDYEAFGGIYLNFGEIEKVHLMSTRGDRDGDGIPDDVDRCPDEPEDKDGFEDDDGCPDLDNDHDGIPDVLDKCPNDAEDKDGFQDEDGCPDTDNDQDGIPDSFDKCPNEPEDKDGFEDSDGCPDPDNDHDGIPDVLDKCPNEPETFNNYKDDDGCPDEVPAEVKKFTGVIEGINFKTGSAEILPGSYTILDRAVKVLQDYPDVNIEISGHTDNKGGASYNLTLSQRRADSVRMYLVSRGIASSRLTSIGFGKDRPIADNKTATGRATNRRTEFRLINPSEKK
jgi:OOP family OmpA-OmpF porin